jgi:hypothetical protein
MPKERYDCGERFPQDYYAARLIIVCAIAAVLASNAPGADVIFLFVRPQPAGFALSAFTQALCRRSRRLAAVFEVHYSLS